jgi:hypothetical protein
MIQHRRRVRILISGAAHLDELDPVWADHFINGQEIAIGHLTEPVVMDLPMHPSDAFPPETIPAEVAGQVWRHTLGQPYLTQLFGSLLVERLKEMHRTRATPQDLEEVRWEALDKAGSYLAHLVQTAPAPVLAALETLTRGLPLDPAGLDRATRRYLRRRALLTADGRLGIPLLGDYLARDL